MDEDVSKPRDGGTPPTSAEQGSGAAPDRGRRPGHGYPPAFRAAVVAELAASGRSLAAVAAEHGISDVTLRKWRDAAASGALPPTSDSAPGASRPTSEPTGAARPARTRRSRGAYDPEERRKAVEAFAAAGMGIKAFARVWGLADKTLMDWLRRHREGGPKALEPRPRGRPKSSGPPTSHLPAPTKAAMVETKRRFPDFGLRKVRDYVARFFGLRASLGAVKTALASEGIATPAPTPRRKIPVREPLRFERARPMQLWQSDITSYVLARQQRRVYLTVFLDDHSRFVVGWALEPHQRQDLVTTAYLMGAARFGKPEEVLTDQGRQYFAWRGRSGFQELLKKEGVRHVVSRAHHPETLGKCERLWETIFRECWDRASPSDLDDARARLSKWFAHYNHFRPHQGIGGLVPADRFFQASDPLRRSLEGALSGRELDEAIGRPPRKPVYLFGQLGEQAVSLHGERGRLVITTPDGGRQELNVEDLGARADAGANDHERREERGDRDGRGAGDGVDAERRVGGRDDDDLDLAEDADDTGDDTDDASSSPEPEADEVRAPAAPRPVGACAVDAGLGGGPDAGPQGGDGAADALAREGDEDRGRDDARDDAAAGVAVVAAGGVGDARGTPDAAADAAGTPALRRRDGGPEAAVDGGSEDRGARTGARAVGEADRPLEGDADAPRRGTDGREADVRAGGDLVRRDDAARGEEKSAAAEPRDDREGRGRSGIGSDERSAAKDGTGTGSSSQPGCAT